MRGRAWRPRQESNLYLRLRRSPFYPLNYGGAPGDCKGGRLVGWGDQSALMLALLTTLPQRSISCAM